MDGASTNKRKACKTKIENDISQELFSFLLIHGVGKKLCHVEKSGNMKIIKIYKAEFHTSLIEVERVLLLTHSVVIF